MNMHQSREDLIIRQEMAARQQELMERKRKAIAEKEKAREIKGRNRASRLAAKHQSSSVSAGGAGMYGKETPIGRRLPVSALGVSGGEEQTKKKSRKKNREQDEETPVSQWFLSICWMKIPLIGFIYAVFLAVYPKAPRDRKRFARGYLIYRAMVDLLSLTVLYIIYQIGLDFVDQLLAFIQ